jgi:hypothetical protein
MNLHPSILWRRIDRPGHEYASVNRNQSCWVLSGIAVFEHEGQPCRLDYLVECDSSWFTTGARVTGRVGKRNVEIGITVDGDRSWTLNGVSCADVRGCIDVDLNFSPSTNLLPIRRLHLGIGEQREVEAAWLRFPTFTLERLHQIYARTADRTYRYESADGAFVAELQVDEFGLPVSYGNIWACDAAG